jgi:two-component system, NtrC family, response regulator GlrR
MKPKVLLVDGHPGILELLGQALPVAGYDLTLASNGQEALRALRETGFDLVLLDLDMPSSDGWDTLGQIITISLSLPLIIMTERSDQRVSTAQKGVFAVLDKPLSMPLLLGVMERALAATPETRGKGASPESS